MRVRIPALRARTFQLRVKPGITMGHRLSKIYTRTGDAGEIGLCDGTPRAQGQPARARVGRIDELNSMIGLLLAEDLPAGVRDALVGIQHDLFDLGGEVCIPGRSSLTDSQGPAPGNPARRL